MPQPFALLSPIGALRRFAIVAVLTLLVACGGGGDSNDTRRLPLAAPALAYDKDDLYRFFVIAFGAAPGVTYMGQLLDAANSGMSVKTIVNVFTTKTQFTDVYPATLSSQEFARKLVDNVAGTSASSVAKDTAVSEIVAALSLPNWTRGDVIYAIFNNLADKPTNDPDWAGLAKKMANQVLYAKYFTEAMAVDTVDLAKLRAVVGSVNESSIVSGDLTSAINSAINPPVIIGNLYDTSYKNFKFYPSDTIRYPNYLLRWGGAPAAIAFGDYLKKGEASVFIAYQNYSPTDAYQIVSSDSSYLSEFTIWSVNQDLTLKKEYSVAGCLHPRKALTADFNQDGMPDVFVACHGYDNSPFPGEKSKLLLSDRTRGSFKVSDVLDFSFTHGASAADLNADGYPDILTAQGCSVQVHLNDKAGSFKRVENYLEGSPSGCYPYYSVEVIDLNSDGLLDVVAGGNDFQDAPTRIWMQTKDGKFKTDDSLIIPPIRNYGVVLDFVLVESADNSLLYVYRTTDPTHVNGWYSGFGIQVFDLKKGQSSLIATGPSPFSLWLINKTQSGNSGVSQGPYGQGGFFAF